MLLFNPDQIIVRLAIDELVQRIDAGLGRGASDFENKNALGSVETLLLQDQQVALVVQNADVDEVGQWKLGFNALVVGASVF